MQINLTITVKGIAALGHHEAKAQAFLALGGEGSPLPMVGVSTFADFSRVVKSYREADGTFTVTIP